MPQNNLKWSDIVKAPSGSFSIKKKEQVSMKKQKLHNVKVEKNGEKYDSKLEFYFRELLIKNNIKHNFKTSYVISESFNYMGKKVQQVCMEPDYPILNDKNEIIAIVDTKGHQTREFMIKFKLLKLMLHKQGKEVPIFLPSSNEECHRVIMKLKVILGRITIKE